MYIEFLCHFFMEVAFAAAKMLENCCASKEESSLKVGMGVLSESGDRYPLCPGVEETNGEWIFGEDRSPATAKAADTWN